MTGRAPLILVLDLVAVCSQLTFDHDVTVPRSQEQPRLPQTEFFALRYPNDDQLLFKGIIACRLEAQRYLSTVMSMLTIRPDLLLLGCRPRNEAQLDASVESELPTILHAVAQNDDQKVSRQAPHSLSPVFGPPLSGNTLLF